MTIPIVSEPEYSLEVYVGSERVDGTRQPARPWIDAAIAETDLAKDVARMVKMSGEFDVEESLEAAAEILLDKIKGQIQDEKWQWDRPTIRSDGSIAKSPRDIVDTGKLLEGQKIYPTVYDT